MPPGHTFDVFLSYNRNDAPVAVQLAEALRTRGLKVFFDRDYLTPGQAWPDLLETHLRASRSAAICLGPQGLGPWQKREQYVALDRQAQEPGFPVIPVLLPGAQDPPLGFLRLETWVDLKTGVDNQAAVGLLERAIQGQTPRADEAGLPDPRAALGPYRGLEPFREEDEPFFVGREAFTRVLIDKVGQRLLIGVVGASGSGKSSVVLAGLVPALRRRADGRVWEIGFMRPGQHPLRQLAAVFLPPDAGSDEFARIGVLKERARQLAANEVTLADVVDATLSKQRGTDRLLLVVDQWEELYTQLKDSDRPKSSDQSQGPDQSKDSDQSRGSGISQERSEGNERDDFLRVLLAGTQDPRLSVVLTLRGDFYGRALQDRALGDRLQDAVVNISPMDRDELRRTIVEPAEKMALSFEPGLVDQILSDVGNEPGNLPLLEFLLKELWDCRTGDGRLTFAGYGKTGGVRRAIAERAETEFNKLSAEQQAAARRFLIRLVTPGEGQADTRARVPIPEGNKIVREVINRFAHARLLTTRFDAAIGREVVEVGHEALIREWDTLKRWVDADREFLRTVQRVKTAMQTWQDEKGDKTQRLLPPGRPLEEARELLERKSAEVDDIRPFVEASVARENARQTEEQREREEEQRRELAAANERADVARQLGEERARGETAAKRLAEEAAAGRVAAEKLVQEQIARAKVTKRIYGLAAVFVLLLLGAAGVLYIQQGKSVASLQQAQASAIWSRLDFGRELRPYEIDELWRLATADPISYQAFWSQLPGDTGLITKAGKRPEMLARTAGLDNGARAKAALAAVLKAFQSTDDLDQHAALASVLAALPVGLTSEQLAVLINSVLRPARPGSERPAAEPDFANLATIMTTVAPVLTSEQAAAAMNAHLQAMRTASGPEPRAALAAGMMPLSAKLAPEPAAAAAAVLLQAFPATDAEEHRAGLADLLANLSTKLTIEATAPIVDMVFAEFQKATGSEPHASFARALRNLAPKTKPDKAAAIAAFAVQSFQTSSDWSQRATLAELLGALPVELTSEQTATILQPVLPLMQDDRRRWPQQRLERTLEGASAILAHIAPKLKPDQIPSALEVAIEIAARASIGRETYQALIERMKSEPAAVDQFFDKLRNTTDRVRQPRLVRAVADMAPQSTPQAAATLKYILQVFRDTTDPEARAALVWALPGLSAWMDRDLAGDAAKTLFEAFPDDQFTAVVSALAALIPKLGPSQATAAVDRILQAFLKEERGATRVELAGVIAGLPKDLGSERIASTIDSLIAEWDRSDQRVWLADELAALAPQLTSQQASKAWESLNRDLASVAGAERGRFAAAMAALSAQLGTSQTARVLSIARTELVTTGRTREATEWARQISKVIPLRPEAEHVTAIIEVLKYPTVAGEPEEMLISGLRARFADAPPKESSLREMIAWIKKRFPALASKLSDLPVRPPRPS